MLAVESDIKTSLKDPVLRKEVFQAYGMIEKLILSNSNSNLTIPARELSLAIIAGSRVIETIRLGAKAFAEAPLVVCSGKNGKYTESWGITEAYFFRRIFEAINPCHCNVKEDPDSTNCDRNYRNSVVIGRSHSDVPLKNIAICSQPLAQLRFYNLHQIYGQGEHLELIAPELISLEQLYDAHMAQEVILRLTTGIGEIFPRLEFMTSQYPDKVRTPIPLCMYDIRDLYEKVGIKPREIHTKSLFENVT